MEIREYQPSDAEVLWTLFYDTVHTINAKDYTKEQLDVWATKERNLEEWNQTFLEHYSVVAIENHTVIGFGDIDHTGYLDRLFVHKDYQGRKVATAICNILESRVDGAIVTHASITARPFFEQRGYCVLKKQQVERQGINLVNYVMEKKKR